ncbi:hypothetical protein [Salipiger aestuarii]|uniref:hypothetical protein n=1 Tax=Salipiger aestuarii TaxID=568098 RepID=UPI00123C3EA5|nr:hypothetical protein [Salipiger aestuarii]KAA8610008.1 hypothetical protein AL037_14220 [Salipiger aestuarii]
MHPALLEIARLGLHALPRASAGALRRYLETARPRLDLPPGEEIELFAPGARAVLARAFADIHHWLGQVSGRVPFFADIAQIAVPRPIPELAAAAAALPLLRADAPGHLADEAALAFLDRLAL